MRTSKVFTAIFSTLILFMLTSSVLFSQQGQVRERINSERIAFFTEKIDLSQEEAEKFWPVYNEYSDRKEDINREMQKQRFSISRNGTNMSDAEMEESLKKYVTLQNDEHELFNEYHQKFVNILAPRKVMMLYVAEIQFKQYLLRKLKEREGMNNQGRRR
jgi:hypothetical protein